MCALRVPCLRGSALSLLSGNWVPSFFVKSFWSPLLPLRFLCSYNFWVSISVVGVRGDSTRGLEMALAPWTRIGFIGAGQMAEAIAKGLNSAGVVRCDQMIAADVNLGRCKVFQSLGIAICGSNTEVQS